MTKLRFVVVVLLFTGLSLSYGEKISSGLTATPQLLFPVGSKSENYDMGIGARLEGLMSFPDVPRLSAGIGVGYAFVPLALNQSLFSTDTNLSLLDLGISLRVGIPLGNRFSINGSIRGSGYSAFLTGNTSGNDFGFAFGAGVEAGIILNDRFILKSGVTYDSYVGLYDALAVNIGITTRFTGPGNTIIPREDIVPIGPGALPGGGNIEYYNTELERVFPVLYKYYDTHPIGYTTLSNEGETALENVEVRLKLSQYMDAPKLSARIDNLEPGEQKTVEIYALFNEDILSITEGAKLASEIVSDYEVAGRSGVDTLSITLQTFDRNAIRWDDDRKIAAFVTARDEEIQKISRNVASIVRDEGLEGFNNEFQLAVALLGVMDVYDCAYVIDPSSSYLELSKDSKAIDSVQFPRQTLQYRAGDCDDLSAAYNALLESVGVETAFITVPGHIYTAFKLEMSPVEARSVFSQTDDLIFRSDDSVWVPVETTALKDGFMRAWDLGSREWREHEPNGNTGFFPVRDSWKTYEPVAFSVSSYELETARRSDVTDLFVEQIDRHVNSEISSRESLLLTKLSREPENQRYLNSLGVLYARYGRTDEAQRYFAAATNETPYVPALLNLGHIEFLSDNFASARRYYTEASSIEPDRPAVILGLARVAHAQEDYSKANRGYETLVDLSPELAEHYTYLAAAESSATRAASAVLAGQSVMWSDE